MPPRQATRPGTDGAPTSTSVRSKRAQILRIATDYFGEHGYEDTKWADVAAAVGIGSTALYHYFESKLHCLYVIMADTVGSFQSDFDRITGEHEDYLDGLLAVIRSGYDLTEHEVLRGRLLVAEQGLVGVPRQSPREEEARQLARARMRDLEFTWATHLARGMERGIVPEADPRLLTRAVLGLYNSIFHWYRPRGTLSLAQVADFYMRRQLAVLGLAQDLLDQMPPTPAPAPPAPAKAPAKAASAGAAKASGSVSPRSTSRPRKATGTRPPR
jgi:TetR/AcrR family transcriptional regulator, cholesterol catabolism regulator